MRRLVVALCATALLTGCALPLPGGVHLSRGAAATDSGPADIQVLPPGPQQDATAVDIVQGFLGAEGSPEGDHQIARRYLTADARWTDDEVQVYDPASLRLTESASEPTAAEVSVSFTKLGLLSREGAYTSLVPTAVTESYSLAKAKDAQWRISSPPFGLRLTPADRDRSFHARRLFFVSGSGSRQHLVPDLVQLPVGQDQAEGVIARLLRGPSKLLADTARTAFPVGTRAVSVTGDSSGVYRLRLSAEALGASDAQRQALSAQLVWTLRLLDPHFQGLVLTVGKVAYAVPGEGSIQRADDWNVFDPEGLAPGPAYFLAAGRLRTTTSEGQVGPGPPASRPLLAEDVAVTPDRTQIALLQSGRAGLVTVRLGPIAAASYPVALSARGLSSPSWGSGERGLWMLDAAGRVVLLHGSGGLVVVPVSGVPGRVTSLTVSRDGARVAMVAQGELYIGRVVSGAAGLRVQGAVQIAPGLSGVTRVAWRDGTTLVALGSLSQTFVPVVLAVDGSSVRSLAVSGLPGRPQEVAASSLGVVVTVTDHLYLLSTLGFRAGPQGRAPHYPG